MTTNVRIIKKYPNRRLYDTEISSYVTLEDLKKLVLQNINFQVVDARTQEDLTNGTLLQIITDLEQQGMPIFTKAILEQMIRFYGNAMQSTMSHFLEKSIGLFMEQQQALQNQMSGLFDKNPMNFFKELTEKQMQIWQTLGDSFRQGFTGNNNPPPKSSEDKSEEK